MAKNHKALNEEKAPTQVAIDGSGRMKQPKQKKPGAACRPSDKVEAGNGKKKKPEEPKAKSKRAYQAEQVNRILKNDDKAIRAEAHRAKAMLEAFALEHDLKKESVIESFLRWGEKEGLEESPATRQLVDRWIKEGLGDEENAADYLHGPQHQMPPKPRGFRNKLGLGGEKWDDLEAGMSEPARRASQAARKAEPKKLGGQRSGVVGTTPGKQRPSIIPPSRRPF